MTTTKQQVLIFLFDGFSDWEIAFLTPEINKSEHFELLTCSTDGKAVTSMGGLQVMPTTALNKVNPNAISLLILPGGTAWEKGENRAIDQFTMEVVNNGIAVAAICAATTRLGQLGLLNNRQHTSNDLNYLKAIVPTYNGEANYQTALAVSDKNIITACGIAPIEFAREVFKTLNLYNDKQLEQWFQLFKNGIWAG